MQLSDTDLETKRTYIQVMRLNKQSRNFLYPGPNSLSYQRPWARFASVTSYEKGVMT